MSYDFQNKLDEFQGTIKCDEDGNFLSIKVIKVIKNSLNVYEGTYLRRSLAKLEYFSHYQNENMMNNISKNLLKKINENKIKVLILNDNLIKFEIHFIDSNDMADTNFLLLEKCIDKHQEQQLEFSKDIENSKKINILEIVSNLKNNFEIQNKHIQNLYMMMDDKMVRNNYKNKDYNLVQHNLGNSKFNNNKFCIKDIQKRQIVQSANKIPKFN